MKNETLNRNDRAGALATAAHYFDSGEFESELAARVAVPTESQRVEGREHCYHYLDHLLRPVFVAMGFECRLLDNPVAHVGPVLLATRHEGDALPTVLGYGHGDVIRGLDDQWTKGAGPWQCQREGDRLYGRGTADNKGQHTINIAALRAVLQARGRLGFNAKFLIESAEENGSAGLYALVERHRSLFEADVLIASDGPRVEHGRATVCLGARGGLNFDLVCNLRDGAHHSGNWGGALADPAIILSHALSSIVSANGQIQVADWLPEPPGPRVREVLADITLDPGPTGPAIDAGWGEPGLSSAERVYAWNSFAVLAMASGNPANPVNAIAPSARAHCQLRYIAGTDVARALPALREHLDNHGFHHVLIEQPPERNKAGFSASRTELDHPWVQWVIEAVTRAGGQSPSVIPQMGGSICNDIFTELLQIPAIWLPHSYTACSQHAPDEHVLLPVCQDALLLMTNLYWDLGNGETPYQRKL